MGKNSIFLKEESQQYKAPSENSQGSSSPLMSVQPPTDPQIAALEVHHETIDSNGNFCPEG